KVSRRFSPIWKRRIGFDSIFRIQFSSNVMSANLQSHLRKRHHLWVALFSLLVAACEKQPTVVTSTTKTADEKSAIATANGTGDKAWREGDSLFLMLEHGPRAYVNLADQKHGTFRYSLLEYYSDARVFVLETDGNYGHDYLLVNESSGLE